MPSEDAAAPAHYGFLYHRIDGNLVGDPLLFTFDAKTTCRTYVPSRSCLWITVSRAKTVSNGSCWPSFAWQAGGEVECDAVDSCRAGRPCVDDVDLVALAVLTISRLARCRRPSSRLPAMHWHLACSLRTATARSCGTSQFPRTRTRCLSTTRARTRTSSQTDSCSCRCCGRRLCGRLWVLLDRSVAQTPGRPSQGGITLDDCFRDFTKPETLDQANLWYCSKCKEHRQARKTMEVWKLPDVLILSLKRFE